MEAYLQILHQWDQGYQVTDQILSYGRIDIMQLYQSTLASVLTRTSLYSVPVSLLLWCWSTLISVDHQFQHHSNRETGTLYSDVLVSTEARVLWYNCMISILPKSQCIDCNNRYKDHLDRQLTTVPNCPICHFTWESTHFLMDWSVRTLAEKRTYLNND